MAFKTDRKNGFSVKVHQGDAKSLLAFSFDDPVLSENLAGFTIQCQPQNGKKYYLLNMLQFQTLDCHAHDSNELPNSSINAPIHKFRWLHVPGSFHQGT